MTATLTIKGILRIEPETAETTVRVKDGALDSSLRIRVLKTIDGTTVYGEPEYVNLSECYKSGLDLTTEGTYTAKVTYNGYETSMTVNVVDPVIGITYELNGFNTTYDYGEAKDDLSKIKVYELKESGRKGNEVQANKVITNDVVTISYGTYAPVTIKLNVGLPNVSYNTDSANNVEHGYLSDGATYTTKLHVFVKDSTLEVRTSNPNAIKVGDGYYMEENGTYTIELYANGTLSRTFTITINRPLGPQYQINDDYTMTIISGISKVEVYDADYGDLTTYEGASLTGTIKLPYVCNDIWIYDSDGKLYTTEIF